MSKRLQVLLEDEELQEIRAVARAHRLTVAEWVRQTLRRGRSEEPVRPAAAKLEALRDAVAHEFPTGDIEQLLAEIDRGRSSGLPR